MRVNACCLLLCVLNVVLCGCTGKSSSDSTAHLQGKVTLNGAELPAGTKGSIVFQPVGQGQARSTSAVVISGKYDSPNTPRGAVKVIFSLEKPTGRTIQSERSPTPYEEMENIVPGKYAGGIDLEVSDDNDAQNFDLAE